jgi:hypothetical protein
LNGGTEQVQTRQEQESVSKARRARDRYLRKMFGLSLSKFEAMVNKQNGVCSICGQPPKKKRNSHTLCVDHDHETGEVRGIVCDPCNRGLACFRDDPRIMRSAARYMEEYRNGRNTEVSDHT